MISSMNEEKKNPSEPMDEGTKQRCDVLQALWENAWKRITDRRTTEWRVSFSLWTALAGMVVLAMQYKISPVPGWAVGPVAGAVFLLHAVCLHGMLKRYWVDRGMAVTCEDGLLRLANVKLLETLRQEREKRTREGLHVPPPRRFPCGLGWWVGSQLLVTALLCAVAALALAGVIRVG